MTTPAGAPTPDSELVAGRIGPPVALPTIRRVLSDHGYTGPLEVARHVWRFDRTAPLDPPDDDLTGEITGYVLVAAHLIPPGWWAHLMVVGHAGDDSERVMTDVAEALYPSCPSWRLDPIGHKGTPVDWRHTTFLPRVLHRWGPLQRLEDLLVDAAGTQP